jgi:hypothetical protein
MNVIGRDHVIEHGESETPPGFKQPVQVGAQVQCRFQEKRLAVVAESYVPEVDAV